MVHTRSPAPVAFLTGGHHHRRPQSDFSHRGDQVTNAPPCLHIRPVNPNSVMRPSRPYLGRRSARHGTAPHGGPIILVRLLH